jgi:hypothetical protein
MSGSVLKTRGAYAALRVFVSVHGSQGERAGISRTKSRNKQDKEQE